MIEFCTKKKMTIAIIFLLSLSLITLIAESAWQTHQKPKEVTVQIPNSNSSIGCKSEKSVVIGECEKCSEKEVNGKVSYCQTTGYKQFVDCDHIQKFFRSCDISSLIAKRNFWIFEGVTFFVGVISYLLVRHRQKKLDSQLIDKINKQIASGT